MAVFFYNITSAVKLQNLNDFYSTPVNTIINGRK